MRIVANKKFKIYINPGNGYFIQVTIIYCCIIYTMIYLFLLKNSIILIPCIFESTVIIHMHI